jgi:hypothetical protein
MMSKRTPLSRTVGMVAATAVLATLITFVPQSAFAATCTITGTAGNDVLEGTAGDDVICGSGGDDTLSGLSGNDTLLGGLGNDTLNGGDGNDTIDGGDGNDIVDGGTANDIVTGAAGADTIVGGDGDDNLGGGNENDAIDGGAGADTIAAGTGVDTIVGGDGADTIDAGDGDDNVDAGLGNDIVLGGNGIDTVAGGGGDDNLGGGNGNDTIDAGVGVDTVNGDAGEDRVSGGDGNDNIGGGVEKDRLVGDAGNDTINGATGDDYIDGGAGDDTLDGGNENDSVTGGDGNDTLVGGFGIDTIDGGRGDDHFDGGGDADTLLGGYGIDIIVGGWGDDTLNGGPGADALDGAGGADICDGSTGANTFNNCETQTQDPAADPTDGPGPTPGPLPETDPSTWVDTDLDIMPDDVEIRFGSDPLLSDTDADGLSDDEEFLTLTNPAMTDTDTDAVADFHDDEDSDGTSNGSEFAAGTNPIVADSDDDGLSDGQEAVRGTNPLAVDTDGDKLADGEEVKAATNPLVADGDGDGVLDGDEVVEKVVSFPESGASIQLSGAVDSVANVILQTPDTSQFDGIAGLRAPPVEVVTDGPVSGTLTIPFDTTDLPEYSQLGIVHFDEESQSFDLPPVQTIDLDTGIATVTTDDFSPFFLVDLNQFRNAMTTAFRDPANDHEYWPPGVYKPLKIVLAFATTDAMQSIDFDTKVKPAVKRFIENTPPSARISVVNFEGLVSQDFTLDRSLTLAAIDGLDDSSTHPPFPCDRDPVTYPDQDLFCLMRTAMGAYENERRVVVAFDDSTVARSEGRSAVPIYGAVHSGHRVWGIPLGHDAWGTWNAVANYESSWWNERPVPDLADLDSVLTALSEEFRAFDIEADSDSDGIPDYVERDGYATSSGSSIKTLSTVADTDGDGLTDGEEVGQLVVETDYAVGNGRYYKPFSDPLKRDTDGDGLGDAQEWDLGTHPKLKDSDGDSVRDLAEVEEGFDPTLSDADGDTFWDDKELADGSDPFSYDFDALGHAHAGFSGLVFGDAWDTDWARALNVTVNVASNGWYLVGQLGSGYLVLGDVRDMIYGIGQGQWLDAGLSLAGFIPGIGDAVKTVAVVKKFATKSATAVAAAVPFVKLLPENQIGAVRKALALAPNSRLTRDINVSVIAPRANFDIDAGGWTNGVARKIGSDTAQAAKLQAHLNELVRLKKSGVDVRDVRVNQHQTNAASQRVGINRPDLQYTVDGKRHYVEYDRPRCGAGNEDTSRRGDGHAQRILNNDPNVDVALQVILVIVGTKCD